MYVELFRALSKQNMFILAQVVQKCVLVYFSFSCIDPRGAEVAAAQPGGHGFGVNGEHSGRRGLRAAAFDKGNGALSEV